MPCPDGCGAFDPDAVARRINYLLTRRSTMPTSQLYVRQFPAEDLDVREDYVAGLVVPWGRETPIVEPRADDVVRYREVFERGAFDRAIAKATRVSLTFNHDTTLAARIGYGLKFADSAEGLVGEFRLDRSTADKARDVLTSTHGCFSVGFFSLVPKAGLEREGELVTRRAALLDHVAAVTAGAYPDARLATVRAGDPVDEGDPSAAEIAAAERARLDADLLARVDEWATAQREWASLVGK
jgi:HK97 family phage prohead protease